MDVLNYRVYPGLQCLLYNAQIREYLSKLHFLDYFLCLHIYNTNYPSAHVETVKKAIFYAILRCSIRSNIKYKVNRNKSLFLDFIRLLSIRYISPVTICIFLNFVNINYKFLYKIPNDLFVTVI